MPIKKTGPIMVDIILAALRWRPHASGRLADIITNWLPQPYGQSGVRHRPLRTHHRQELRGSGTDAANQQKWLDECSRNRQLVCGFCSSASSGRDTNPQGNGTMLDNSCCTHEQILQQLGA